MKIGQSTPRTAFAAVALAAISGFVLTGAANVAETSDSRDDRYAREYPEVVFAKPASPSMSKSSDGATFYETGPVGRDTLVVLPEIYEAAGLSYGDVADITTLQEATEVLGAKAPTPSEAADGALAWPSTCGGTITAIYGSWSTPVTSSCSVAGNNVTPGGYKVSYRWSVTNGTNQDAAVQGMGFYTGYNGSQLGTWSKYYGLGVGSSGGASVPWGNVWAEPKARAQSTILIHIAQVKYEH